MNENTWKIKQNILFPPAYGYRLLLFSRWVMSNTLQLLGQQHTRVPCPSLFLGVCWNPCPLHQWCHPTILSPFVPFSTCLPSFPALGAFPLSCLFTSGDQSTGASASSSVLPRKIQGWFPLGLTFFICLWSKGLTTIFSRTAVQEHQLFSTQPYLWSNFHTGTWLLGKP